MKNLIVTYKIIVVIFIAVAFSCNDEETVAEMKQGVIGHDEHRVRMDTPFIDDQAYRDQDYQPYRVLSLDSFTCADNPQPGIQVFQPIDSVPPLGKFFCCYGEYHGCKEGHYFQGTNYIAMDWNVNPDTLWNKATLFFFTYELGYKLRENMYINFDQFENFKLETNKKIQFSKNDLQAFHYFSMNSEIFLNQYKPIESKDSWILFTHIDTIAGRMEGRMNLHLYNSEPNPVFDGNPDTFRIEQIEFWAEVNPYSYD